MVTTIATWLVAFVSASGPGPIAASIERHARDAVSQSTSAADGNWAGLARMARGTEIVLRTTERPDARRVFIAYDEASVTVLNVNDPVLPAAVARQLREVAMIVPDVFDLGRTGHFFETKDGVRVGDGAVFVGAARLCDLAQIVERVPRSSVVLVRGTGEVTASRGAVIAGVVVGGVLGVGAFVGATECRIAESVTGCKAQLTAPLWTPVLGGLLGYGVTRQVDRRVFYQRD